MTLPRRLYATRRTMTRAETFCGVRCERGTAGRQRVALIPVIFTAVPASVAPAAGRGGARRDPANRPRHY